MKKLWYVFDNLEIIMGPYERKGWAEGDLKEHIDELYFLEYYPNPYIDFILDEDESLATPYKERIIKRKVL